MSTDLPSFDKAEYAFTPASGSSTPDHCTLCQQPIAGSYYRVNGNLACKSCATQATASGPADSHAAFTRAILCGIAAAVVGMILYALFEIATGIIIGYLAIGVGFLVGKAMKYGSDGRGGLRYQIAAALFTYASVSVAAVPVAIYNYTTHKPAQTRTASSSDNQHPFPGDPAVPAAETRQPPSPAAALITLVGLGLASPFLELSEGFGGIIGLFILFIGIRFAWNFTAGSNGGGSKPDISGPYTLRTTLDE